MIRKTEAIVLSTRKFGDSSLITTMYTRQFGRQSYLVKGYRSTKGKKRHSYFQPMSILDIVFYYKETRDLQLITETSSGYFFSDLQTNPLKITLGMVITEIFYLSVKEEEQNDPLYEFMGQILKSLDATDQKLIHIFIYFLVHLTRFLGFFPRVDVRNPGGPVFFNIQGGILENAPGARNSDHLVAHFCKTDLLHCQLIPFDNAEKSELISTLLQYYHIHVEGFKQPESLKILYEVFR